MCLYHQCSEVIIWNLYLIIWCRLTKEPYSAVIHNNGGKIELFASETISSSYISEASAATTCNRIITMVRNRQQENIWGLYWPLQCAFSWRRKNKMWLFTATRVPKAPTMWLQPASLCWMIWMSGLNPRRKIQSCKKKKKWTHITVCQFTFQLVETEQIQPRADPWITLWEALYSNQNIRKTYKPRLRRNQSWHANWSVGESLSAHTEVQTQFFFLFVSWSQSNLELKKYILKIKHGFLKGESL